MKKIAILLVLMFIVPTITVWGQGVTDKVIDQKSILDSLTTIDPNIKKWFPRWNVCEPDLQVQIYSTFLYKGFEAKDLNQSEIQILAAPKSSAYEAYQILSISCGSVEINAVQIDSWMTELLVGFLSGDMHYTGALRGYPFEDETPKRDYCYVEIPAKTPLSATQAEAIIDYMNPTNASHVFTLSLFEQAIKIGSTGFWLRSSAGNDDVGFPFWYSGQNNITLQRPLLENKDDESRDRIPNLLNVYLGVAYRHKSGLTNDNSLMSWVPNRTLNSFNGGYLSGGFDYHLPMKPELGIAVSGSMPLTKLRTYNFEEGAYGGYAATDAVEFTPVVRSGLKEDFYTTVNPDGKIAPVLMKSGRISAFYHLWLNKRNPENYFRFDFGYSYSNVQETGVFEQRFDSLPGNPIIYNLSPGDDGRFTGLKNWVPETTTDWLYLKVEYRNQAVYPFGASAQLSNGIFLGKLWIPLFGSWFYLEAKYSTPIHDLRPYEIRNYFVISPVIKISI
ncbi:MAG: hypothetical protein WCR42_00280 [bacterium]